MYFYHLRFQVPSFGEKINRLFLLKMHKTLHICFYENIFIKTHVKFDALSRYNSSLIFYQKEILRSISVDLLEKNH